MSASPSSPQMYNGRLNHLVQVGGALLITLIVVLFQMDLAGSWILNAGSWSNWNATSLSISHLLAVNNRTCFPTLSTSNTTDLASATHVHPPDVMSWTELAAKLQSWPDPPFEQALKEIERLQEIEHFDFEGVSRLLQALRYPLPAPPAKYKYDLCQVIIMRNELFLKEHLVRGLLAGYQHVYVYDNNRISEGKDMNVTDLLAPFIAAGIVEHFRLDGQLKDVILGGAGDLMMQHRESCRWLMNMDGDEYLVPAGFPQRRMQEYLSEMSSDHCQIQVPWLTMYDEGYVYRRGNSPGDSLLTSYPRVCGFSPLPKFLYQSEFLETPSTNPHYGPPCPQGSNRTTVTASGSAKHPFLVHYYSKSLEDFVIKKEQSLPPYYRSFRERISFCPLGLKAFPYDDLYVELVEKIMAIPFVAAEVENFGGGGLVSGPASAVNLTREEVGPANDYELYQFVKEQLKNGCNFDKECYLKRNPRAREAVSTGVSLDALQYFLSKNFTMTENSNECWGACKTRAS